MYVRYVSDGNDLNFLLLKFFCFRHRHMFVKQIDMDHVMKVGEKFYVIFLFSLLNSRIDIICLVFVFCFFQAKSIREFDKRFTSVMFGYRTIDDYYIDASPNHRLKSVGIPVLCLNSVDDVFSPSHGKINIFIYILA